MDLGLNSLGRYPLSVVLSFLTETEGTGFLLTQTRYARQVLPLFRLPLRLESLGRRKRHCFQVIPVQDPETLLDRLNTRRLRQRCRQRRRNGSRPYELNRTTTELANLEWTAASFTQPVTMELLRFLTTAAEEDDWGGVTLLASYPRSGNTLLRTLLERVTGTVTGADTRPDRPLSKSLALDYDLVGEGVTQCVRVVKTHFPERQGHPVHVGHKAILLIRNPYDAIDSYWNLNLTNTHTETVTEEVYARFADFFEKLAIHELGTWIRFHLFWWQCEIPVLWVRFEDLIVHTERELGRIICFITGDCEVTDFWKCRIHHACGEKDTATLGSYRPRSASGRQSIGKSLLKGRYSKDVLQKFQEIAQTYEPVEGSTMLRYFGYDLEEGFPINLRAPCSLVKPRGGSASSLTVNVGPMIRQPNDPYGRALRQWRHSHTNKDANPFPTVSRN